MSEVDWRVATVSGERRVQVRPSQVWMQASDDFQARLVDSLARELKAARRLARIAEMYMGNLDSALADIEKSLAEGVDPSPVVDVMKATITDYEARLKEAGDGS